MSRKRTIRRIVVLGAWMLVIAGIATLLIAANGRKKEQRCRKVSVVVRGVGENYYIEKEDIQKGLEKAAGGPLLNREVNSVPLATLERQLERNAWIRDAELYFDSRNVLHVVVWERQPVARVFTTTGTSFYLDSAGQRMPLLEKVSARVPVVTGFTAARRWNRRDSLQLKEVKAVAAYIYAHSFWNAQVGQIDITADGFELIPTVGRHVIRLGSAEAIDQKLHRLYVFYRQVLRQTGFDRYSVLDVRFDGQVVAVNRGVTSDVDSVQLQKNIAELLERSMLNEAANAPMQETARPAVAQADSVKKLNPQPPAENITAAPQQGGRSKPEKANVRSSTDEKRQPKAVMKRREGR